jgi:hypothetical protein
MKTARYRKKCFDQIEGITASNRELATEVERCATNLKPLTKRGWSKRHRTRTWSSSSVTKSRKKQVSCHFITISA